ncbi:cupin domain-containing protein [Streptomyces sp. NPDC050804]|uniref:cupin domain-containing protein n=1 Tax=Streptomyces sp. NPDC050804 TaxID=3154745 RepID=UPI00342D3AFD
MTARTSAVVARLGEDFLTEAFGRTHRVLPGADDDLSALMGWDRLGWDDLNDLLARHRLEPPRLRLSADGEVIPQDAYTAPLVTRRSTVWQRLHPAALHDQLTNGATLVIDAIDELHDGVRYLASALEAALRTQVQVNAYASWTGREGFGVHWDDHDVVVVQISGAKRWKVYGPTRVSPMHQDVAEPEVPPEKPVDEFVLTAGDMLYLPRGWWHSVAASEGERSLHLTCGLTTTTGADLLIWLSEKLRTEEIVRADLPRFGTQADKQEFVGALRGLLAKELESGNLIDRYAEHRDATERVRLRPSLPFVSEVAADANVTVEMLTTRHTLASDENGNAVLTAGGETWTFAPAARPLLDRLTGPGRYQLRDLVYGTDLSLTQAASIITELVKGQVVSAGSIW